MKALHLVPATLAFCMFGLMDVSDVAAGQIQIKPKPTQIKPQVTPQIKPRIKPPKIIIRPDVSPQTKRLIEVPPDDDAAKAGPQPEPPTRPAPEFEETAKSPPLPTPRPELGASSDIRDLENVTGGDMGDLKDAATMLEDGLEGQNALPEEFRAGEDDFADGVGGERQLGRDRVGAFDPLGGRGSAFGPGGQNDEFGVDMMSGIPRSPASEAPGDSRSASDAGWVKDGAGHWSRNINNSGWWAGYYQTNNADGSTTATVTLFDDNNDVVARRRISVSAPDENGDRTVEIEDQTPDGETTNKTESTTKNTVGPKPWDQNGNGVPDAQEAPPAPPPEESQPNPVNDGAASGICKGWSPLTGCGRPGPTLQEMLTQPGTSEESTATATGAKPVTGPEAVTNPGDGSYTAGGNRGGGGSGFDPCAIQAGDCGTSPGDLGGPDGGGPVSSD